MQRPAALRLPEACRPPLTAFPRLRGGRALLARPSGARPSSNRRLPARVACQQGEGSPKQEHSSLMWPHVAYEVKRTLAAAVGEDQEKLQRLNSWCVWAGRLAQRQGSGRPLVGDSWRAQAGAVVLLQHTASRAPPHAGRHGSRSAAPRSVTSQLLRRRGRPLASCCHCQALPPLPCPPPLHPCPDCPPRPGPSSQALRGQAEAHRGDG